LKLSMKVSDNDNNIEVLVFGPGYGESILINTGCGEWILADSCINPETRKPAVSEYLGKRGLSPDCIKLIIATHWHDDHIRGLCEIVKEADNAEFVLSQAFRQDEFLTLMSYYGNEQTIKSTSGIQELYNIVVFLKSVNKKPKFAVADRILFERKNEKENYYCEIRSLSPSDASIMLSNARVAELIPQLKTEKRRLPSITPNHSAVVLWIRINNKIILLGSDLENTKEPDTGWTAILSSNIRLPEKAKVFKIPHHGSYSADHPKVWEKMIDNDPFAVLTPFKNGGIKLPELADIERIYNRAGKSYITATLKEKKAKTEHKIDKLMEDSLTMRKLVHSNFGYVQLQCGISNNFSDWKVNLFDGASELSKELIKKLLNG